MSVSLARPRRASLDQLRRKYQIAVAQAAAAGVDLDDAVMITYTADGEDETEISPEHFLTDAKCSPGKYRVLLRGAGMAFDGEAVLSDPTGGCSDQTHPTMEAAKLVSSLLRESREHVEHGGSKLREAWARISELEQLTMAQMKRLHELECARPGDSPVQRELVTILGQMCGLWMGLGGPMNGARVQAAWSVLTLVLRSPAVQAAIRAEGPESAEVLRVLLEGR